MATSVVMPALEMAQQTGRLLAWRKREGDPVLRGEPLMDVETDKAVVEIEAEADGILAGIRAREGDVVNVGQTIAWIVARGERVPVADGQPSASQQAAEATPTRDRPGVPAAVSRPGAERPLASPRARRLAAERGVDLRSLRGSGPDGAVHAGDVAMSSAPHVDDPPAIWRLMADRVTTSWTTVPQFFVTREVDATALVETRARLAARGRAESSAGVTYTDLLVALVASALRKHPRLNASWSDGAIRHHDDVNVGIATAVEQGVVVPVIRGADRMPVRVIVHERRELVDRARAGRLRPADLAGGTFTISNLGMYDVQAFSAIVNPPQAAILAVGRIADRVVAHEGRPVIRPLMALTLSCDHRVVDGARAAAFLADLGGAIEDPESVLGGA